ncbi:VanZ family protein [Noviherbaspirillum sp.]|uniref:VanZ family protein n=1 Tax=Noviherbaspirillum sp. TaxID=1926288 RepID=UPI002B482519|nr:VanZ family protein [Noviherbaspirillum sp.]HJV80512.1 VanZ family protein [Noviherbaspirillum sp.]
MRHPLLPLRASLLAPLLASITPRHYLFAAVAFFSLMVGIGAIPGQAQALSAMVYDKLLHVIAYAFLTGLVWGAVTSRPLYRAVQTVMIVALLGGVDESIQSLMPYRDANWLDWQFDVLASVSCVVLLLFMHWLSLEIPPGPDAAGPVKRRK